MMPVAKVREPLGADPIRSCGFAQENGNFGMKGGRELQEIKGANRAPV